MKIQLRENKPVIILSAYTADRPKGLNEARHRTTVHWMKEEGIALDTAVGCYKGTEEQCIIAEYNNLLEKDLILEYARNCEQESVLMLTPQRTAALLYVDTGGVEILGKLKPVSEQYARKQDAWTRTDNGQYYVVVV